MRRITGSNFVRCAATADRLGDASRRRGGSAALNRNGRRSYARRRAAFRPPIRTAQSTPSILGTTNERGPAWQAANELPAILPVTEGPNAQRRRNPELARYRRDAVTWAGPVVVDDFPQEIPITRRELDVIETYLGALLDEALGVPE
jgi:hypothetical protein